MQRLHKMSLYRNRYRVETTRLQDRDYTEAGLYFVTICVKDGRCVFGNIRNSEVLLSPLGVIAFRCWQETPRHHAGVELDSFVVMPNHLHGIVKLPGSSWTLEGDRRAIAGSAPPPKKNSLGAVICSYKSAVSRQARLAGRAEFRLAGTVLRSRNPQTGCTTKHPRLHPPEPRQLAVRFKQPGRGGFLCRLESGNAFLKRRCATLETLHATSLL